MSSPKAGMGTGKFRSTSARAISTGSSWLAAVRVAMAWRACSRAVIFSCGGSVPSPMSSIRRANA